MAVAHSTQERATPGPWNRPWLRRPPWWVIVPVVLLILVLRWSDIAALRSEGRDLMPDYLAARALVHDQDLFTPFEPGVVAQAGGDPSITPPYNGHPPTATAMFVPFAAGSFSTAALLWSALSVLALVAGWWLATRELDRGWLVWLSPVLAFWFPVVLHLRFGQWSTVLFLGLSIGWVALRRGDDRVAGLAFAACALIKVFPGLVLVLLIVQRRWAAVRWMLGTCLVVAGAVALWRPKAAWSFVVEIIPSRNWIDSYGNASVRSLATKAFAGNSFVGPLIDAPALVGVAMVVGTLVVVGVGGFVLWRTTDLDLRFAAVVVAMLLLSPVTWVHSFVILLLVVLIVSVRPVMQRARVLLVALAIVLGLTCIDHWHLQVDLIAGRGDSRWPGWVLLSAPGVFVLLALLTIIARVSVREARVAVGPEPPGPARGAGIPVGTSSETDASASMIDGTASGPVGRPTVSRRAKEL